MDICVGDLHESYRMPAVGATASATTSNAIPDIVASTASAAFSMTWGTTKDIRLKITFLLTLASLIGGFISLAISATLIHRFGVPLDRWLSESSLLFLPAYVLSAGLIALTLFKHRGRVSIKLAFIPALAAEIAGPYCGLILAVPFGCLIASDCF